MDEYASRQEHISTSTNRWTEMYKAILLCNSGTAPGHTVIFSRYPGPPAKRSQVFQPTSQERPGAKGVGRVKLKTA